MIDQEAHTQGPNAQPKLVSAIGQPANVPDLGSRELNDCVIDAALIGGGQTIKVLLCRTRERHVIDHE
jgi:hypothetical protein